MNEIWEFLVPTKFKDKPIKEKYHKALDKKLKDIKDDIVIIVPTKTKWKIDSDDFMPLRLVFNHNDYDLISKTISEHYKKEILHYILSKKVVSS